MEDPIKLESVFSARERNLNAPIKSATSVLLASLRSTYPGWVVTLTPAYETPLRPFAEAGHASASLDTRQELSVQSHSMQAVKRRDSREPGKVTGSVTFGKYDYTWNNHSYIVYFAECQEGGHETHNYFILYHRNDSDQKVTTPRPVSDLIAAAAHWNLEPHEEIFVFDQQMWVKDKELYTSVMSASWDDVILDAEMKANVVQDLEAFFDNREAYQEFAVPWKRGLIFHGTPGNGKTISLKALMRSLYERPDPVPTLYVKSLAGCGNEFYAIRLIFDRARKTAPCLLIFEDLDSLIKDNVKSFFLNEIDGLEDNNGLLMIGSTNYLDRLDPGISKRPSRFDRKYHFAIPAKAERAKYCRFWQHKLEKNDKVDFPVQLCDAIAQVTDGFSFAYLKEAFITALLLIVGAKRNATLESYDSSPAVPDHLSSKPPAPTTNGHVEEQKDQKQEEDEKSAAEEISPEEKEAYEKANRVLDDFLLGRVIRKQIETLHIEMEEARKSVDDSEQNAGPNCSADVARAQFRAQMMARAMAGTRFGAVSASRV